MAALTSRHLQRHPVGEREGDDGDQAAREGVLHAPHVRAGTVRFQAVFVHQAGGPRPSLAVQLYVEEGVVALRGSEA